MKKQISIFLVVAFFCMTGSAWADLTTYTETFLGTADDSTRVATNNQHQSYAFQFDLGDSGSNYNYYLNNGRNRVAPTSDASGFNPSTQHITGAALTYALSGNSDFSSAVLTLTSSGLSPLVVTGAPVAGQPGTFSYQFTDTYFQYLEGGSFGITFSTPNNMRLETLSMNVTASSVPVPGALWLLGSGMVGLFAIRRRARH